MGEAELVRLGVIALREEAVGEPYLGSRAVEELGRHDLAARRCNQVSHGRGGDERPLPVRLALDARRRLVAGDHRAVAHGLMDGFRALGKRLGRACEHVGDRAFGNLQAEQALQHLRQARVADHLAAVKIGDERDDAGAERGAGRHVGGRLGGDGIAAAATIGAVQVDPRRHRLDRRQFHVVIGAREHLVGGAQFRAAGAALGVDIARRVGVGAELAGCAGAPFAASLRGRRVRDVGLLSARWRQRRVRRRLRRLAGSALEFGDARQQRLVLLDEIVDLRQQGQNQPLQTVGVERIDPLRRHPELESNGSDAFNAALLSHSAAGGE